MGHKKVSSEPYYPEVIRESHKCSCCERCQADKERLEGIIVRFKAGCKITGRGQVDKNCEMVEQLQSQLAAEKENASHHQDAHKECSADRVESLKQSGPKKKNPFDLSIRWCRIPRGMDNYWFQFCKNKPENQSEECKDCPHNESKER